MIAVGLNDTLTVRPWVDHCTSVNKNQVSIRDNLPRMISIAYSKSENKKDFVKKSDASGSR
mgnify:CR=1 FL=1